MNELKRKSPTESATDYKPYTIKKGNDKSIYITIPNKNKVNRWMEIYDVKSNVYNFKLMHSIYNQIHRPMFKFIAKIIVEDNLTIGDSIVYELKNEGFGKGQYYIYRYNQCLIASKRKLSLSNLLNKKMKNVGNVTVDYGVFCFRDMKPIIKFRNFITDLIKIIYKRANEIGKKISYPNKNYKPDVSDKYYEFPMGGKGVIQLKKLKTEIVTSEYFTVENSWWHSRNDKQWKLKKYFNKDEIEEINSQFKKEVFGDDNNKVIMIIASNYFGDGSFPILSDNNGIIMQCGLIFNNFITRIEHIVNDKQQEDNLLEHHYR